MSKEETLFDLCGQVNQHTDYAKYHAEKLREEMDAMAPIKARIVRELKALGHPVIHNRDIFAVDDNGRLCIVRADHSYERELDPELKDEPPVKEPCTKYLDIEVEQDEEGDESELKAEATIDLIELFNAGKSLYDTFKRGMQTKGRSGSLSIIGLVTDAIHALLEEVDEEDDEMSPLGQEMVAGATRFCDERAPITPVRIGPESILPAEAATDCEDEQEERLHVAIVDNEVS